MQVFKGLQANQVKKEPRGHQERQEQMVGPG